MLFLSLEKMFEIFISSFNFALFIKKKIFSIVRIVLSCFLPLCTNGTKRACKQLVAEPLRLSYLAAWDECTCDIDACHRVF